MNSKNICFVFFPLQNADLEQILKQKQHFEINNFLPLIAN